MRLLIVTTASETFADILRDQPRFLSQYFDVILATGEGLRLDALLSEGVPVHVVKMTRVISPLMDLISIWNMARLMRRIQPDIVHSFTPKAGLVSMLAGLLCRIPVRVHTFTGLIWPISEGIRKVLLIIIDRLICACATHIVPEGMGVKSDLLRGRITKKPLNIIGYGNIAGVDVNYFNNCGDGFKEVSKLIYKDLQIKCFEFVFIFVGRLHRDKGLVELLNVFIRLPTNCRLIIVGGSDLTAPIAEDTMDLILNHSRVHWLGFLNDIRPALAIANVLVLPSYREGFPNVLLQASAMAVPAIATDISGSNEIIETGFNGWLVPPRNALALENAMLGALETPPDQMERLRKASRERVIERFERNAHWHRVLNYYRSILSVNL